MVQDVDHGDSRQVMGSLLDALRMEAGSAEKRDPADGHGLPRTFAESRYVEDIDCPVEKLEKK